MTRNLGLTLPYNQDMPAVLSELLLYISVALNGAHKLVLPEIDSGLRHTSAWTARVAVPIAAMDEDRLASLPESNVWLSRHVGNVYSIAISETPQGASNP